MAVGMLGRGGGESPLAGLRQGSEQAPTHLLLITLHPQLQSHSQEIHLNEQGGWASTGRRERCYGAGPNCPHTAFWA